MKKHLYYFLSSFEWLHSLNFQIYWTLSTFTKEYSQIFVLIMRVNFELKIFVFEYITEKKFAKELLCFLNTL